MTLSIGATSAERSASRHSSSTPTHQSPSTKIITNIQSIRGIVALMVLLGHAVATHPGMGFDKVSSFMGLLASSGVDFFFVISGFIITTVAMKSGHDARRSRQEIAWNFAVKRLTRIYPVFWVAMVLAVPMSRYVEMSPNWIPHPSLLRQVLLLTSTNDYIMSAWSLGFEVYFYIVVTAALFIWPRRVILVLCGWSLATGAVIFYGWRFGGTGTWIGGWHLGGAWVGAYPFSPLVLEFIFGMIVAWLINKRIFGFAAAITFLGAICFAIGLDVLRLHGWFTASLWWRTFYSGVPSALLTYGLVALEMKRGWRFAPSLSKLGDASYSIYIWHQPLFFLMFTVCLKAGFLGHVPDPLLVGIWAVIALWIGFISYRYIEIPIQTALNGRLLK